MKSIKADVARALSTDSDLLELIPKTRMFNTQCFTSSKPVFPYLTFYTLINREGLQADNEEIESESTIRIDLYNQTQAENTVKIPITWGDNIAWGENYTWNSSELSIINLEMIAFQVDKIMKSLDFTRNYFQDLDEINENGIIKHKVGSYTVNF